MTDNERMDRAKRIKRMREGRRDGEDASDDEDEPIGEGSPAEHSEPTEVAGESVSTEQTPAEANGGAEAVTEDSEEDPEVQKTATTTTTDESQETVEEDPAESADAIESTAGSRAEIPDTETMEAALEEAPEEGSEEDEEETAAPAAGIAGEAVETTQEADTRVLEFTLANEQYGLDIRYIEEIVKHTNITRVPNTPPFVEGVVDLRGQITTILNPKETIGKDDTSRGDLIVVFDSEAFDDQNIGWVVDDVSQVSPVHDEEVNDPPMDEEYINGVIDRDKDDQFVIWTTPDLALEEAG